MYVCIWKFTSHSLCIECAYAASFCHLDTVDTVDTAYESTWYIFYVYDRVWSEVFNFFNMYVSTCMVKILSMFHLHCNFVNLWRMAKQSSRYALKKGLGQAFHVWLQPLFQQGLEIWVKGSHLLYWDYWATNQPESFTSDVRWDVLDIAKMDFHHKFGVM